LAPQSRQSSGAQHEVKKGKTSSGVTSYTEELRKKKLKGSDGGRGIIRTELQKYLNKGLEEAEVGECVGMVESIWSSKFCDFSDGS